MYHKRLFAVQLKSRKRPLRSLGFQAREREGLWYSDREAVIATILDPLRILYYIQRMIVGFRSKATEQLWHGVRVRPFDAFAAQALRKLTMLEYAHKLSDLLAPPGNQLEALRGDRTGQYSIRINGQWRICFLWTVNGPDQVEIVD
jgi:proteic killer suppression protein